ncbi:MAG: deoxyribodipyrimidine photo-lyase [Nitrospirales bacterium]|nr:MAG: deoxyribodipyrimidine photo-lyase [Nitrospirales bacterium]
MKHTPVAIMWFRQDLRLKHNPALLSALQSRLPIVFVYIFSEDDHYPWSMGGASRWWLHQSLSALEAQLRERNHGLVIRQGNSLAALQALIQDTHATHVYWNRCYEPHRRSEDLQIREALRAIHVTTHEYNGSLLIDPEDFTNNSGRPYQVFTPFWKRYLSETIKTTTTSLPVDLPTPKAQLDSIPLKQLGLEPTIDWANGIRAAWTPGEAGALKQFKRFVTSRCIAYEQDHDRPDRDHTSQLSPHLHFGEVSPQQVWSHLSNRLVSDQRKPFHRGTTAVLRQLAWRDFSYHLLYHYPHTPLQPLREKFATFKWESNPTALRNWQRGVTGYPFVDAGMRQLWKTGWMHNRVRMVVASFLTKHLLLPWQRGAEWFWDTLVDADLANNTMGWQWVAGCGADAAPYFRIFYPITQGLKFDPAGEYVSHWIPELAKLPVPWIHKPWEAPPLLLAEHGITLGTTYPYPIVDHHKARQRALAAFAALKKHGPGASPL